MSFGHQSDVHNHLSTKHPLFSHRMVEDNAHGKIVEPERDEGQSAERAPPAKIAKPEVVHSHS
jgi:hypothetical protein